VFLRVVFIARSLFVWFCCLQRRRRTESKGYKWAEGNAGQCLSKTVVGEETEWTEYAGLCVGDEIMVDLIMDPQYKISSRSLSDVVIMSFTLLYEILCRLVYRPSSEEPEAIKNNTNSGMRGIKHYGQLILSVGCVNWPWPRFMFVKEN